MRLRKLTFTLILISFIVALLPSCRNRQSGAFVIAISDKILTLDTLSAQTVDAGSERLRQMLFNSLVRKNEKFEYVGELASNIDTSQDGLTVTFTLHDNVTFHDGKPLTAADAKYTLDTLLASSSAKATSFFEGTGNARQPFITGIDAPDARTLVIHLRRPWIQLFVNLVPINIIPSGSISSQKDKPIGSGPFKFKSFDATQQVVELEANPNYWEGAPQIQNIRLRVITDASPLQAELLSGTVQLAPNATNLTPDIFPSLAQNPKLKVEQFPGANVVYLGFNTTKPPVSDARVRQAICYAIDRETIIHDLLLGQAKLAHSILPEESWAYSPGTIYNYDPGKAKQLLDEAGFRDPDGDGPKMRFQKPINFKISSSSAATRQYVDVIRDSLQKVGIPVEIETMETNTLLDKLRLGEFQMTTLRWVGGNQDPIFLRDIFDSAEIPTEARAGRNRSRYKNPELDTLLEQAVNTADRDKAVVLYRQAQEIISRDLPMLPLWYPANMVVASKTVGNIHLDGSGDWKFVRDLTWK